MPRRCSICDHPDREAINRELSSGGAIGTIAAVFGASPDALKRHKANHLMPAQRDRLVSDPELADVDVLSEVRTLYRKMRDHLDRAEAATDWPSLVAFHREARADLELLAKLVGRLGDGSTVVNVQIDARVQTVILEALEPFPDARVAVAEALRQVEGYE